MTPSPDAPQHMTPRVLNLIRWFLLGSVLFVGGIFWFLVTQEHGGKGMLSEEMPAWLTYALAGGFVLIGAGVLLVQRRQAQKETFVDKGRLCITGWAMAEGTGFAGAVYLLLTGRPALFLAGFALMLLTCFVLLPVPCADAPSS